jgi:hypothetical protein
MKTPRSTALPTKNPDGSRITTMDELMEARAAESRKMYGQREDQDEGANAHAFKLNMQILAAFIAIALIPVALSFFSWGRWLLSFWPLGSGESIH